MKKENAQYILDFLEYIGKNMIVKDNKFEYHRDALFNSKCLLRAEVNGDYTSDVQALNLADVSQQRELLLAYHEYYAKGTGTRIEALDYLMIDSFLSQ